LEAAGVAAVFGPGAGADHIVATINSLVAPSL
jgi:methylmalonyl-CoA mutase cobalamin-binding subunit